jgi:hypothetical protein
VPVFVTVIVCAAEVDPTAVEGNVRLLGESETVDVAVPIVPLREAVANTTASVCAVRYIVPLITPPEPGTSEATGEKTTESVQVPFAAMIFPEQVSVPATTEKPGSENAATGASAVVVLVNGNAFATPINIGIEELFVNVNCTGMDALPTGTAGVKLTGADAVDAGLTAMVPGLVGTVPAE